MIYKKFMKSYVMLVQLLIDSLFIIIRLLEKKSQNYDNLLHKTTTINKVHINCIISYDILQVKTI